MGPPAVLLSLSISLLALSQVGRGENSRPIVGIVCHEISAEKTPDCYIPASYVKAVESAGARVVPIFLARPVRYYREMVRSLNGVVFPGGEASETTKNGYYDAASVIFTEARRLNYEGDNFPILGVCLGFEFLAILSNGRSPSTLDKCRGMEGTLLPLTFLPSAGNSTLYSAASDTVIGILSRENVTINYHDFCLRAETKLRIPWTPLTTNRDADGKEFVSSMAIAGGGPIAGIQFHPEKAAFEWQVLKSASEDSLTANRHFYDWLVTEARRNNHTFDDPKRESASLIYNYCPVYTAVLPGPQKDVTQAYIFKRGGVVSQQRRPRRYAG